MHQEKQLTNDLYWVGGNDRRLALFENVYPLANGVSYNSYLLTDDKTVLFDTVDKSVYEAFFENLEYVLNGRKLDYVVVNHMEPDHAATLADLLRRYSETTVITSAKAEKMIQQYFEDDFSGRVKTVKEGETFSTGHHILSFVMAPMVHWPEVMVTYDSVGKILFSADAFGTFGALSGNYYADELDFEGRFLADARRYYANIVGKYGTQVQSLLRKAASLDISMICPLHGPIWRKDISWFIDKYLKWSTYEPEETALMIAYASVYGHTENVAAVLADKLGNQFHNIVMYDVSSTDPSVIVSESFRCSHLVFASTTYNAGIFSKMETVLLDIKAHNLQNRTVALIENGSWAPTSGSLMREIFASMKNIRLIEQSITIRSAIKSCQEKEIDGLAAAIIETLPKPELKTSDDHASDVDTKALQKLSYGLFILTAKDGEKDNGCVINTAMQVTGDPLRISVCVNKQNYTHDMIKKTGLFNVSMLSEETPFSVFQHFGFQSGSTVNKFENCTEEYRSKNGLLYLPKYANGFLSGKVTEMHEYETHTLFVASVTEAAVQSSVPSMTYQYYFDHVKPKRQNAPKFKKGYVCKICGYVYEGDELPEDFVCPLCKHPASDFEEVVPPTEKKTVKWVCKICGYVYEGETLPADYVCPLCKHPASDFERIEE